MTIHQYDAFVPADREAYIVTLAIPMHIVTRPTASDVRMIRQSVVAWRIRASDGAAEPVTCEGYIPRTMLWLRPGLEPFELYEPRSGRTYKDERVAEIEALRRAQGVWDRDEADRARRAAADAQELERQLA